MVSLSLSCHFSLILHVDVKILRVVGPTYTNKKILPVHLPLELLEQDARRSSDVGAVRDGDESPALDMRI